MLVNWALFHLRAGFLNGFLCGFFLGWTDLDRCLVMVEIMSELDESDRLHPLSSINIELSHGLLLERFSVEGLSISTDKVLLLT